MKRRFVSGKTGDSIHIGDDIVIVVKERNGSAIKLGVQAPKEIPVYCKEIHDRIKAENLKIAECDYED